MVEPSEPLAETIAKAPELRIRFVHGMGNGEKYSLQQQLVLSSSNVCVVHGREKQEQRVFPKAPFQNFLPIHVPGRLPGGIRRVLAASMIVSLECTNVRGIGGFEGDAPKRHRKRRVSGRFWEDCVRGVIRAVCVWRSLNREWHDGRFHRA